MGLLFSPGPKPRRIQGKREPAKHKRRNEAREFAMNGVRAQRANHNRYQHCRSGSPRPWNQHTEAGQDFKHPDDILSVGRVAPMREQPSPSHGRRTFEFLNTDQDKYNSQ
jgi:hypothetical protein